MNHYKSTFRSEIAIIPTVAWWIALLGWVLVQVGLLGILPHHAGPKDLPPMPWWSLISIVAGTVLAIIVLMVGYVNADSKRRGMNSLLWTLLVIFVPKALGFIAYFLLRKPLLIPCPKCGTAVGADFRFCPKCGNAVTPMCSHCGRSIQYDSTFCPYCGKTLIAHV
ncbi:MAG TPA: zinc ribbon domain-containing protein [Terriglobales bacterium]|nr:zinc ribbon domain-containing protein [Terriglobales bacterium]